MRVANAFAACGRSRPLLGRLESARTLLPRSVNCLLGGPLERGLCLFEVKSSGHVVRPTIRSARIGLPGLPIYTIHRQSADKWSRNSSSFARIAAGSCSPECRVHQPQPACGPARLRPRPSRGADRPRTPDSPARANSEFCARSPGRLDHEVRAGLDEFIDASKHQPRRIEIADARLARYLIGVDEYKGPLIRRQVLPRKSSFAGAVRAGNDNKRGHPYRALLLSFAASALST